MPSYERQPISELLKSSFGFTLGLVVFSFTLDFLIQSTPPLQALASSVHEFLTHHYKTFYDYILVNHTDDLDHARTAFIVVVFATQPLHTVLFWAHCLVLSLFDCFPKTFAWAHKWKIQNHDEPVPTNKVSDG